MNRRALIVFAKAPMPGRVKTRLVPPLTLQQAADLYRAFQRDAAEQFRTLDADVRWYVAGPVAGVDLPDPGPRGTMHRQSGSGLGERMLHAFTSTFAAGYDRVVIVGTDMPTLPTEFVSRAFDALGEPRTVTIGPAEDGGYYLLGMTEVHETLFRNRTYSHDRVLEEALERIATLDARSVALPTWYDVDSPAELERLAAQLRAEDGRAPHTARALDALGLLQIS